MGAKTSKEPHPRPQRLSCGHPVGSEKSEEEKELAMQSASKSIAFYEYSSSEILGHLKNAKDVQIKYEFIETTLLSQKGRLTDLLKVRRDKCMFVAIGDINVIEKYYFAIGKYDSVNLTLFVTILQIQSTARCILALGKRSRKSVFLFRENST